MIDIEIGIVRPELTLQMPADQDTLPLVRQALRSLGETVDADLEALEDAELAVTEACANAVEHAYADGEGDIEVRFTPRRVRAEGQRGRPGRRHPGGHSFERRRATASGCR